MSKYDRQIAKLLGKPFKTPGHGPCCTCQTCGYDYDDCVCGFSEYFEDAWDLVDIMTNKGIWLEASCCIPNSDPTVYEFRFSNVKEWSVEDSMPEAICAAFIASMERIKNE